MNEQKLTLKQAKKANDKPAYIILLFPAAVTIISYIIFSLFWGDNSPLLYLLPDFLQNLGAMKINAMVLIEQGKIVKSNAYIVLYLFIVIYFIAVTILSIRFELFVRPHDFKGKRISTKMIAILWIFIVGMIVSLFVLETLFTTRYGIGRVFKLGLYGLVIYSLFMGVTGYLITILNVYIFHHNNNRRKYNGK